jgi:DNA-binding transcriptional regulator YhcF (GntR family)
MLKLKNLLSENAWDRKFGEPLPTLKDVAKKHKVEEHTVTFTKDEMEKLHSDGKIVKADPDGKDHTYVYNESVNENIKVVPSNKIDSKVWRNMKYDLRDQFDELVKIGPDYGVFQNAQGTAKLLKQIQRLIGKI